MTAEEFRAATAAEWDATVGVFRAEVNSYHSRLGCAAGGRLAWSFFDSAGETPGVVTGRDRPAGGQDASAP